MEVNGGFSNQMSDRIVETYIMIKKFLVEDGYGDEINYVEGLQLSKQTDWTFFKQYVFVVLSTAISNQAAESVFREFMESNLKLEIIRHKGKRAAITEAKNHYREWFQRFNRANNKLAYLATLPFIGPVTKFHLARNLGLDVAKPDRHLVRLSSYLGFENPHEMCQYIAERTHDRIGVVDVVLWRACNIGLVDSLKLEKEGSLTK